MTPLSFERLHERGCAIAQWLGAGGSLDRLAALDRRVRRAAVTDWPGRPSGPEPRWPWETAYRCARCGADPRGCGCWSDLPCD